MGQHHGNSEDPVGGMRVNRELVSVHPLILAAMSDDQSDVLWEAFVIAMLAVGPTVERRSRYSDMYYSRRFTVSVESWLFRDPGRPTDVTVSDEGVAAVAAGAGLAGV